MSYEYSENELVQNSAIELLRDTLGWRTFYAYNDIQYMFGKVVDTWSNIIEIKANVKLDDFILGDSYTTDFVCTKDDGELMVRECVFISKINKRT